MLVLLAVESGFSQGSIPPSRPHEFVLGVSFFQELPIRYELFAYFLGSLTLFALSSKGVFILVGIVSLLTGAAVWWLCSSFGHLWYKAFHRTLLHWLLSGFAAVLSILFVWAIAASVYASQVAVVSALLWRAELSMDAQWNHETFSAIYDAVKKAGHEDFTNFPPPPTGTFVPVNHSESNRIVSRITSTEVYNHFRKKRPLLGWVLHSDRAGVAKQLVAFQEGRNTGEESLPTAPAVMDIFLDLAEEVPVWSQFLGEIDRASSSKGPIGRLMQELGVTREGIRSAIKSVDEELERVKGQAKDQVKGETLIELHYSIVANQILDTARVESGRIRLVLILGTVALWLVVLAFPLGIIGYSAHREADLSSHRPRSV